MIALKKAPSERYFLFFASCFLLLASCCLLPSIAIKESKKQVSKQKRVTKTAQQKITVNYPDPEGSSRNFLPYAPD